MTNKHSIWKAAENIVGGHCYWIMQGPWIDAEYEDTLDEALEHLQSCCEAVVDDYYEEREWLECQDDAELLQTILDHIEQDHRWYNDIVELLFMNTLAGA